MIRLFFVLNVAFFQILLVDVTSIPDSPCGDWIPFENEKCIKLVSRQSGLQTKEDAEIICKAFVEELHIDDVPKLVTVKTQEKQMFLEKLLFEQLEVIDSVWLGLNLGNNGTFSWNDGTGLFFSNWVEEAIFKEEDVQGMMADRDRNCVHMDAGAGTHDAGKWVLINCKKRNTVVCERDQSWNMATLQNVVLNLKLEVEQNGRKLKEANQKLNEANLKIERLEDNPVPLGFVYVQLPGQQDPSSIWPNLNWTDVSSTYEGLFFRVAGGNAAPFGQLQNDTSPRLSQVQFFGDNIQGNNGPVDIPSDGSWSERVVSGGFSGIWCSQIFRMTTGEVRPINKAVIVWQRTG